MRSKNETKRSKESSSGTLADVSLEAVGKLLRRCNKTGRKKFENSLRQCDSIGKPESGAKRDEEDVDSRVRGNTLETAGGSKDAKRKVSWEEKVDRGSFQCSFTETREELDDSDWEDGPVPILNSVGDHEVTIELNETPDSTRRKRIRRASAEDKELAELVHKVHLLCLLARGRLIDRACDDALIQATLLSLLPVHLLHISKVAKPTVKDLRPLVFWFQNNFHIRSTSVSRSFYSALTFALETHEGTQEEIAALSVALFRALNLTTRFVSILDVASLKPDADKTEYSSEDASRSSRGIFSTSTPMVARKQDVSVSLGKSPSCNERDNVCGTSQMGTCRSKDCHPTSNNTQPKGSCNAYEVNDKMLDTLACGAHDDISEAVLNKKSQGLKRRGDLEFEMQLKMALSATAVPTADREMGSGVNYLNGNENFSYSKRMKRIVSEESRNSSQSISTAVGSRKVGSPLYWAEVYCNGENLTGKWVHIDAINAIIDGEQNVEALAAACKTSLRYAVAFAGNGAKDVTRRYCLKWYQIASQRVNSIWWDAVLAPLRDFEVTATSGSVHLEKEHTGSSSGHEQAKSLNISDRAVIATRNSLEDMELETKALTEPLPTNQQAYKNHQLYAIEKWLTKDQVLHPKGPIVGFCSGHPVYPRTCVQTLKTRERWLREGLQVKINEHPVKELKRSSKVHKVQDPESDNYVGGNSKRTIELYGKWQLEPLDLPRAVNGIVPKNDHGNVEVWSEKCLPPGTVHLRLPRVFYVAKRLEIDYAPAMVGFEFKNGQSYPVFDGIVVCAEFRDAIVEAYAEEEERREAVEKKRNEMQAISRWYQLLSSVVTRQRHDILFFWVARMVMMGIEFTGTVPFKYVYLHGLIRDSQGRKMSKTLGNVIDPLDTIKEYGTDALRFTIALGTAGQDLNLSTERLTSNKAFTNKLWNAGKFVLQNLPSQNDASAWENILSYKFDKVELLDKLPLPECWVISKLHLLIDTVTASYDKFFFGDVGRETYEFFWGDFADWYIEASKARLYHSSGDSVASVTQAVLLYVFENILKLLHPFMPFVTEELWQALPYRKEALIISPWPLTSLPRKSNSIKKFENLQALTRAIRNARAEYSVEPVKRISASIVANEEVTEYIVKEKEVLALLSRLDLQNIHFTDSPPGNADQSVHLVAGEGLEAYLPLADMIDITAEIQRLSKRLSKMQTEYDGLKARLSSPKFVEKAPEDIVRGVQEKAAETEEKITLTKNRLALLKSTVVVT